MEEGARLEIVVVEVVDESLRVGGECIEIAVDVFA